MRKLLMTLAAALSMGLFATSASAASRWSCEGSELVCGSTHHASASHRSRSNDDAGEETTSRRTRHANRHHHQVVASSDSDEDRPVRHRARRSSGNYDSGGSSSFSGKASYYWEPQALASGGRFNPNAMTAAHKTLPFGTRVRVTNQRNGQSVVVTINDRGPYVAGRVIDLSKAAASAISMTGAGVASVSVAVLGR